MNFLKFKNKKLFFENLSIENITKKINTPFYLYSSKQLNFNFNTFKNAFKKIKPLICFSVKSNSNIKIINELKKNGSGADVVSLGELKIALKAGIHPKKIVFSGVGKSYEELSYAISKNILLINAESESEITTINHIAKKIIKLYQLVLELILIFLLKLTKKYLPEKKEINLVYR